MGGFGALLTFLAFTGLATNKSREKITKQCIYVKTQSV